MEQYQQNEDCLRQVNYLKRKYWSRSVFLRVEYSKSEYSSSEYCSRVMWCSKKEDSVRAGNSSDDLE